MFVRRFNVFGLVLMVCALLLATTPIFGQATTGSLSGTVVSDADNSALPGVTVEAVHTPTGTRYSTVSGANGRFTLPNVRVGGPYKVTATLEGFRAADVTGVEVSLGQTAEVPVRLKLAAVTETVTVTARPDEIINPGHTGSTSMVNEKQIETLPTVNRSLQDFARTNPYFNVEVWDAASSRMTVAGRNNRYNTIQIDGAVNNDLFGLADTGTPGGQANTQPISLDAIQQIQLVVSPYDVRQGGFTGGGVNAVTRSGTNKIEGSAYGSDRNQNWIGVGPFNTKVPSFKQTQYGARVGGPILKDRLFFFVNGEENRRKEPKGQCASLDCPITYSSVFVNGVKTIVYTQTQPDPSIVRSTLQSKYGYDPGDPTTDISGRTNNNLGFLRFDFNVNNSNQLTLRHNYVGGIFDTIDNRSASTSLRFPTSTYAFTSHTRSTVGQLNSVFSAAAFNEARIGYQSIKEQRSTPVVFPSIEIGGTGPRTQTLIAGTERFSGANALNQKITELTDDFTLVKGAHTITVGTHNEIFSFKNTFLSEFTGYYYYPTMDAFLADKATEYRISYATGADPKRPASFGVAQYGLYASDQWHVMNNVTLTFGLRGDKPSYKDTPSFNSVVQNAIGYNTASTPQDKVVWSPRIGFNWNPGGSTAQQLRGGIGVFSGRTPYVWISNAFANTGIESIALACQTSAGCTPPTFVPDPANQPKNLGAGGALSVDLVDPNFQFPRVLRGTLGYDRDLFFGIRGTVEGLYSKTQEDVFYINANRKQVGTSPLDGRPTYDRISTSLVDAPLLTNSDKGHEALWTLQLVRPFTHGLTLSANYAHQNTETSFDATSSRAISNWQFRPTPGDIFAHNTYRGQFEVKNRYNLSATYDFGTGPFTHNVGLFWNAQEGHPYSVLMGGDPNKDLFTSNDVLYVPSDVIVCSSGTTVAACVANNATAAGQAAQGRWTNFISSLGIDPSQSQTLKANQFTEPWSRELDFHYELGLPQIRGIRASVQVDMLNLLNLMDREFGVARSVVNQTYTPVVYVGQDPATNRPVYRENFSGALNVNNQYSTANLRSRWQGKLGFRVTF